MTKHEGILESLITKAMLIANYHVEGNGDVRQQHKKKSKKRFNKGPVWWRLSLNSHNFRLRLLSSANTFIQQQFPTQYVQIESTVIHSRHSCTFNKFSPNLLQGRHTILTSILNMFMRISRKIKKFDDEKIHFAKPRKAKLSLIKIETRHADQQ